MDFFVCIQLKRPKRDDAMTLDLTQGAVSEKLNVVGQTELLHLRSGTLVNDRVLNLQDTAQTVRTTAL